MSAIIESERAATMMVPAGNDLAERAHSLANTAAASAIRTRQLTKTYGPRNAVNGVNLEVPVGVVAGFVGPNGAGKTTTIRMLLALIKPTAGSVEVLGVPSSDPSGYLPRVGALIEGPAFYPTMSARRNLEILAALGGIDKRRIDPLLAQVGLQGRERDAVKTYSLGMRQRLGIAAALLPNPALLILDEPTNGLDPAGIQEIRQLIRQLREQGVTILISSHLLAEVEQIADWIILVNQGEVVYQGWMDALLESRQGALIASAASENELRIAAAVASSHRYESTLADGRLRILAPASFARTLNKESMAAGAVLTELTIDRTSLEETFFSLTEPRTGTGSAAQLNGAQS
jgi:ABC-2 type transport system ATP-binding protein